MGMACVLHGWGITVKHAYTVGCECKRCAREAIRRKAQSVTDYVPPVKLRRYKPKNTGRVTWGSAEWAETRGDDLGYSGDY